MENSNQARMIADRLLERAAFGLGKMKSIYLEDSLP